MPAESDRAEAATRLPSRRSPGSCTSLGRPMPRACACGGDCRFDPERVKREERPGDGERWGWVKYWTTESCGQLQPSRGLGRMEGRCAGVAV
jgi:hypothetical protein